MAKSKKQLKARAERLKRKAALFSFPYLLAACEALADFVEEQYRRAMPFAGKAEMAKALKEHALLGPVRAAIAKARGA